MSKNKHVFVNNTLFRLRKQAIIFGSFVLRKKIMKCVKRVAVFDDPSKTLVSMVCVPAILR